MTRTTRLHITIGRNKSPVQRIVPFSLLIVAIMAIPTFNELVLHGHWSVNLIGAVFGAICFAAKMAAYAPYNGVFDSKMQAANWILSGKWERSQ